MRFVLISGCVVVLLAIMFWGAARFLIVNSPARSNLIVVLSGGDNNSRVEHGLHLLEEGYGDQVFIDEGIDAHVYGSTRVQLANDFIQHLTRDVVGKVQVCSIGGNSTFEETQYVASCVSRYHPKSILLVTSDYHTRRALAIFARMLPQYESSIAGSMDHSKFGTSWWKHREWAKYTVTEWSKLIWWETVDRWRAPVIVETTHGGR
jgi:uncharacterized SAM-binding protein YcdF (DUF218 family)